MAVKRIHHLNFLVRNLDKALAHYAVILDLSESEAQRDELPERGVLTARFKVGETWLVLVQPTDDNSIPARYMQQHGEGFFLLSLYEDNIEQALKERENRLVMDSTGPRQGLDNWTVWDIDSNTTFGAQLQFCQED